MAKQADSEMVQLVKRALDQAGEQSFRGGRVHGRSGYVVEERITRGVVKGVRVYYVAGENDVACTDYTRNTMLPAYREALIAAGLPASVRTTMLAGDWVSIGV